MKYYDTGSRSVIDLTQEQYDFLSAVLEFDGDIIAARAKYVITDMLYQQFIVDEIYWAAVTAAVEMRVRAKRLNPDYLKDFMVASIDGTRLPSKQQMQAVNLSMRMIGLGQLNKSTRVEASPDSIKITFDEGMPTEARDEIPRIMPPPTKAEDNPDLTR